MEALPVAAPRTPRERRLEVGDEDGDEEVQEDVVADDDERDEVDGGAVADRLVGHVVDIVPVLDGDDHADGEEGGVERVEVVVQLRHPVAVRVEHIGLEAILDRVRAAEELPAEPREDEDDEAEEREEVHRDVHRAEEGEHRLARAGEPAHELDDARDAHHPREAELEIGLVDGVAAVPVRRRDEQLAQRHELARERHAEVEHVPAVGKKGADAGAREPHERERGEAVRQREAEDLEHVLELLGHLRVVARQDGRVEHHERERHALEPA